MTYTISQTRGSYTQSRQSTRERIPRRQFEIEREVFMIAPHDDEEPKNVKEALSSPKAKE